MFQVFVDNLQVPNGGEGAEGAAPEGRASEGGFHLGEVPGGRGFLPRQYRCGEHEHHAAESQEAG